MIHAYGVVRAPAADLPVLGVDGAPLRGIRHDDLALIGSDHAAHLEPTRERLIQHATVLDALLAHGVVPLRYGTALADDGAAAGLLAERAAQFRRLLGLVHGRHEMGIRVRLPNRGDRATTGRDYLLGKLDTKRGAGRLAGELDHAVGPLSVDRRLLATGGELRVAYLVDADRVSDFRARVSSLAHGRAEIVCTGPWPAYSFVNEDQP